MKICDRLDLIMRKEGMLILMMLTQGLVLMYLCYININDKSRYKNIDRLNNNRDWRYKEREINNYGRLN